jgi:hypothetical protein
MLGVTGAFSKRTQLQIVRSFVSYRRRSVSVYYLYERRQDSSVGIATGYELHDGGSIPGRGKRFFFSPVPIPDMESSQLLYNGFRGIFLRRKSGRGVKLTTHL